jgi:hypothetical protein
MPNGGVPKPTCGSQGPAVDDVLGILFALVGAVGSVVPIIAKFAAGVGPEVPLVTIFGISAVAVIWLAAVAGAALTFGYVLASYWNHCLRSFDRLEDQCSAGVINGVVDSFGSATDQLFPFTATHDRVDIVVKSAYWNLVQTNAQFVPCAKDDDRSPLIHCYYEDEAVCAAGLGATIGAGIGAIGGILAGVALAALIGCASVFLCLFAILVALLVAAAIVLAGALIGGQVGKWAADESKPTATSGEALSIGDYVTTKGDIVTLGDDEDARVYWFVDETTLHGHSAESPEFSYRDPDENLNPDACPINQVE